MLSALSVQHSILVFLIQLTEVHFFVKFFFSVNTQLYNAHLKLFATILQAWTHAHMKQQNRHESQLVANKLSRHMWIIKLATIIYAEIRRYRQNTLQNIAIM